MAGLSPLFTSGELTVRRLGTADEGIIQNLLERCADYNDVVEGRPVDPTAGRELLVAAPEGWRPEDVLKLGIFDARDHLLGVLEVVEHYPTSDDWHIGLLLLDPAVRGRGVGERLYRAFEEWAADRGGRRVLLVVVEDNVAGFRFWRRMGFKEIKTYPAERMGAKVQSKTEMERVLPPQE